MDRACAARKRPRHFFRGRRDRVAGCPAACVACAGTAGDAAASGFCRASWRHHLLATGRQCAPSRDRCPWRKGSVAAQGKILTSGCIGIRADRTRCLQRTHCRRSGRRQSVIDLRGVKHRTDLLVPLAQRTYGVDQSGRPHVAMTPSGRSGHSGHLPHPLGCQPPLCARGKISAPKSCRASQSGIALQSLRRTICSTNPLRRRQPVRTYQDLASGKVDELDFTRWRMAGLTPT